MKILVLNGPNLNMVGIREKNVYGEESFESLIQMIEKHCKENNVEVICEQSNHEGDLVDWIQQAYFEKMDGIVINPGAYTHTSIAIADAISAIAPIPVVEVHISNIYARDEFRSHSVLSPVCAGTIAGFGINGYFLALQALSEM